MSGSLSEIAAKGRDWQERTLTCRDTTVAIELQRLHLMLVAFGGADLTWLRKIQRRDGAFCIWREARGGSCSRACQF
jgi:hypothetical protein